MNRRRFMGYAILALEILVLVILVYVIFFMK